MKTKCRVICTAITLATLAGCASSGTTANVIPMAGGIYRTSGFGESENKAQSAALKSATNACGKSGGQLTVNTEQTKYKGVISESSSRNLKKIGSLADNFVGWIPSIDSDDDYEVTMTFSCNS